MKCFVSVGAGDAGTKPITEGPWEFMSDTIAALASQTEAAAEFFVQKHRYLCDSKRYFRFNVHQGLERVGLKEYEREAEITAATIAFIRSLAVESVIRDCALNLKSKQCRYLETDNS